MTVQIHRSRQCEFTRIWEADASTVTNLSTLQQQYSNQQVTWSNVDPLAVSIANNAIELQTDTFSKFQILIALPTNNSLHRLSLRLQLPQDGQAALHVHLPMLEKLTMTLGSASADAAKNEVFLGSSQNTSVVAELPCISDVTDTFRDVDFVWDNEWMRWYVDDILLLEEFIQDESMRRKSNDDDCKVIIDLSVAGSGAKLAVQRMTLHSGNASDPFCAPRYSTSSNCRVQTSFSPRLGSIRGSLSVDEVERYIDEVAAAFPLIIKVEELGQSVEKRPLRAFCLGACYAPQEQKIPQALFTGMHHAREPISMMNLVYTIDILTSDYRNGDLAALEMLTSRQLWFILVVNPDGYAHNEMLRVWEHNYMGQRKSAAPTCNNRSRDAGVDLNRNYDVCFARDTKGSSNEPCGDDYNGPHAFSEPETQAVRGLVERYTSDFSVALNYHSYGRYFNLPFACKAKGEPTEANNSVFVALAQEMARFNGFDYGQSWKESNLYTVNGDTSDWMWQAHGIFAISPEVGPAFETKSVPGFWPSRDDVPQLSSELHYSNLHVSRMAGPVYSLVVNGVQLGTIDDSGSTSSVVSVDVTISNGGLRSAPAELVASVFANGTSASNGVHLELKGVRDGSASLVEKSHTLSIPYTGDDFHHIKKEIKALYIVMRDTFSCHLFRVAVHFHTALERINHTSFQTWTALPLPRCGTCELFFGASENSGETASFFNVSPICNEIKDVAFPESVHIRNIDSLAAIANRGNSSAEPVPIPNATPRNSTSNVASSGSASAEVANEQQTALSSSILPSASWSGPVAMISLAGLVLLVVATVFFRRCYRRNNKKPASAKSASKGRRKVQYSRIDEEFVNSPVRDRQMLYDEENEKNDLVDAECGERGVSADDEDTGV